MGFWAAYPGMGLAFTHTGSLSFGMRSRLKAAQLNKNNQSTLGRPVTLLAQRSGLFQPAESLLHQPAFAEADAISDFRVVRPSIALRRFLLFWITCGDTFSSRRTLTNPATS